ncbi:MAG: hypothetical protein EBZ60_04825 [Betaproteobacteria bacterium]|nr:hypothetical protein [Betaproteobacteria bacterium]
MLEALAAMMVLNLLALGVLFGQFQAWQAQRDVLATQHAVALAHDLWHRMQINVRGQMHYQWPSNTLPAVADCERQACDEMQWAQADLLAWWTEVQLRMPGAQTQITTSAMPAPQVRLQFRWPMAYPFPSLTDQAQPDCPDRWHCWESTWRL